MFSGIVERLGVIVSTEPVGGSIELVLDSRYSDLELGESVAVNGVCLTVTTTSPDGRTSFFVSPETIARSNLGDLDTGALINLERSVRLETRLSGHLVQGHVDGLATLVSVAPDENARNLEFELPADLARYCVEKGSVALNGISLTINALADRPGGRARLAVTIIPHTWDNTNLHRLMIGDRVNIEVDVIAKYVERLCQPYPKP